MNLTVVCQSFDRSSILLQPWRYVYEISRRIVNHEISVTIISDKDSIQPETEEIERIKICRIRHPLSMIFLRKRELVNVILKSEPGIVVWHGTPLSALYLGRLKAIKKPLVWVIDTDLGSLKIFRGVSLRELCDPQNNSLWIQILTSLLPRFVIRRVANSSLICRIIVPSDYLKTSLCKIGVDASKITVIPSTIEKDDVRKPPPFQETIKLKEDIGFKAEDFIVTYFGSPSTLRGTDTAVRSVEEILPKLENIKLVVLSRRHVTPSNSEHEYFRNEERRLKKLIGNLKVEGHVTIIPGMQSRSKLRQYICASDVIALPFKIIFSDPPLSVLEAMSLGKVVVTTNIGSLNEIVHCNRGMLIEPGDSNALAEAIVYLSEHLEKRESLEKSAQQFAANLPDWDLVALEFAELMKEVFEKNSRN